MSALLRIAAALIGALFASGLAVLAVLLLLLAVAIRLRVFLILLVGGVSHFPSPCAAYDIIMRHPDNPLPGPDVPPCGARSPGRGPSATNVANIRRRGRGLIGPLNH